MSLEQPPIELNQIDDDNLEDFALVCIENGFSTLMRLR